MTTLQVVGGTKRRRYTKRQKNAAVATVEMSSQMAAAEALGIPRTTIQYWLERPEFGDLRRKTREETAEGFGVLARMAQSRLQELIPTMEPRDLVVLLGVATDKDQLLAGHATTRSEHRDLADELDDHERKALRDAIDKELESRVEA